MKNHFSIICAFATLLLLGSFTFENTPYKVDTTASSLAWFGSKITGDSHTGNIDLKSGNLLFNDGKLKGGSFIINMESITCTDIENETYNKKLVDHLKSDDFFGVANFPEAMFSIKSFANKGDGNYNITGDLTIKGTTHSISFPANITEENGKVTASAKITFDRSKFGVRYGSDSFFDNLGNKAINNEIVIDVHLIATK